MKRTFQRLTLTAALMAGTGCGDSKKSSNDAPSKAFEAELTWTAPLAANEDLTASLTFLTLDKQTPTSVDGVTFDPQMPSMGHGTATDEQVITLQTGSTNVFDVKGIYFTMGGKWVVNVKAKVNGADGEVAFPVDIP